MEYVEENIDMVGNRILDLPDPIEDSEPVTKGYANKHYSGSGGDKGDKGDAGPQGPKGDKGDTGNPGPKRDKDDTGNPGPKGDKGDSGNPGRKGYKGDSGIQGLKGDKGNQRIQGIQGIQGLKGDKGDKGDPGNNGSDGPRGLQGVQGLTDPRGRKGNEGDKGDPGVGFTASGVTMSGNIDMGDNKITNLKTPTSNTDAITKKYVDDREPKFKDGTTTTSDIDLRKTNSDSEFYDDVTFKAKSKCKDLNVLSSSDEIVNKNTLKTGGLVRIQSLNFVVQGLFTQMAKTELLIMKGNPTSSSILKKHTSVNGNPTLTSDSDSVTLDLSFARNLPNGIYKYLFDLHFTATKSIKIFLYGECGGTGYKSNTIYEHCNVSLQGNETETNKNGGYFHRGYGQRLTFSGEFRHFGDHLRGLGVSYSINSAGVYNKFLNQEFKLNTEPKLLSLHMTWVFEEENGASVNLTADSYFYMEGINII